MNFQIETVSFCDLTCQECPNWQMKRERQFMSREVWDTILNRYVIPYRDYHSRAYSGKRNECPPTVIMHKDGEPLLNKNLPALLQSIPPGFSIDIYTHGLLLPKRPGFFAMLGSLPNRVRTLISFHFNNHDGSVNDYSQTEPIIRDAFWHRPPNVEMILASHLVEPQTVEKLAAWRDTWSAEIAAGLAVHANCSINPWTGLIDDPNCVKFNGCPYGDFGHMFFGASGNIVACCLDLEEEIVFGNVMVDDPAAMVAKLEDFYEDQRTKIVKHGVCHNCHGLPPKENLVQIGAMA